MSASIVNTVLGPVDARELGVTLIRESLLYVLPGAQYAYDIRIDRSEVFDTLEAKLLQFKAAGGGTIVDASGMYQGRDLALYEALARTTGVHIVASTGQGPEAMLGGYFLTPQTNPPTPWPAEKFADLFALEITEGMVVPRFERRAPAGLVATAVTVAGMTPTDGSLVSGAARTGKATGVAVSISCGADAVAELQHACNEGISAERVVVGDLDRRDAAENGWAIKIAQAGAKVAIDHVGTNEKRDVSRYLSDAERVQLIKTLIAEGFGDRVLLSSSATGVSFGDPGNNIAFSNVLTDFVPLLKKAGVSQMEIDQMLVHNAAELLGVKG
jgi:phosphotriesterase-related protein